MVIVKIAELLVGIVAMMILVKSNTVKPSRLSSPGSHSMNACRAHNVHCLIELGIPHYAVTTAFILRLVKSVQ